MKTLTHLHVDGLKSLSGVDLSVPPLLALHGPNGAGKTALLQAIRLGVLGYEPSVGRTLERTRLLAGGETGEIDVGLTFADGFGVRRTFGERSSTEVAPPEGERTEKQAQERIHRETGAFLPCFDLAAILDLSAEKRRAYLFGLLPRELARLNEARFRSALGYQKAHAAVQRSIDRLWIERVMAAESPVEGLASAIAYARDKFLEAERERQAQQKVAERSRSDAAAAAERVTYDPAAADPLHAQAAELGMEIAECEARLSQRDEVLRQRADLERRREETTRRLERAEPEAARMERELGDLPESEPDALGRALDALSAASALDREARQAAYAAHTDTIRADTELNTIRQQIAELGASEECPTCGGRDGLAAVLARLEEARATVEARVAQSSAVHADAATRERDAAASYEAACEAEREQRQLSERRSQLSANLERQRESVESCRQELERIAATRIPEPPEADAARAHTLSDELREVRQAIRAQEDLARQAGKAEALAEQAAAHEQELAKVNARTAMLKDLYSDLQRLRGAVIEEMVRPVEQAADEILSAIDPSKQFQFVFEREGKDTFDFGFVQDDIFRSYDAASTGEDAFLAVVLVAGLIAAVQPAWPVLLIDNAEAIDEQRRAWLMEALARVANRFGNVVMAGCCEFEPVEGWEVVDVRTLGAQLAGAA